MLAQKDYAKVQKIQQEARDAANRLIAYQALLDEFDVSFAADEEMMKRLRRIHEEWAFDDYGDVDVAAEAAEILQQCIDVFKSGLGSLKRWRALEAANRLHKAQLELGRYGVLPLDDYKLAMRLLALRDVWNPATYKKAKDVGLLISLPKIQLYQEDVFHQLQTAISEGTYRRKFPVGSVIDDFWYDADGGMVHYMPWRIVDYRTHRLANGREALGATLLRVNASPNRVYYHKLTDADFARLDYYVLHRNTRNEKRYLCLNPYDESDVYRFATSDIQKYLNSSASGGYIAGCSKPLRRAVAKIIVTTDRREDYEKWKNAKITAGLDGKQYFVPADDRGSDETVCQFFLPVGEDFNTIFYGLSFGNIHPFPQRMTREESDAMMKVSRSYRSPNTVESMAWEYFTDMPASIGLSSACEKRSFASPDGTKRAVYMGSASGEFIREDGAMSTVMFETEDEDPVFHFVPACVIVGEDS